MIDWTKPLQLADGTALTFSESGPDSEGDYYLVRADGKPFDKDQVPGLRFADLIVHPDGKWWLGKTGQLVFNVSDDQVSA